MPVDNKEIIIDFHYYTQSTHTHTDCNCHIVMHTQLNHDNRMTEVARRHAKNEEAEVVMTEAAAAEDPGASETAQSNKKGKMVRRKWR